MAACCGAPRCNCRVTAGPGVTVDGNGSAATPYVISADSTTPTAVQAADTATVDTTVAGSGTTADPYIVSSDVILDPAPPGGGSNLLQPGADGLYVECADVRTCFSAGDGATYDPATGEFAARPSTDAGNLVTFGTDGGLLATATAADPTAVDGGDTPTAHTSVTGTGTAGDPYVVTTDVVLDPAPPGGGSNLAHAGADGLYVECADVRSCLSAGDGITYDPATGEIAANISGDADNTTVIGTDGGIYTPAASTAVQAGDTDTVDVTVEGTGTAADPYVVSSDVKLDSNPPQGGTNLIGSGPDGLFVECADVRTCFTAGDGATYDPVTGEIGAHVSTDSGNQVTIGSDGGLYAAGGGGGTTTVVTAGDTPTANNTVSGTGTSGDPYVVSTDVVLDSAPPGGGSNLLQSGTEGLFVECADVRTCFTAGDGATYDPSTGEIGANISGDTGNTTVIGTDGGIYTPAAATVLEAADTPTVDVTVSGTGSTADPYQVAAAVILDPTPPQGGTNLLQAGPEGLFVECADVRGCLTAVDGIAYDPATGEIEARPSTDAGNIVTFGTDGGLYATGGGGTATVVQAGDTPTANNTVSGTGTSGDPYVVSTDVVLDPAPPGGGSNLLQSGADGLFVECADVRSCLTAGIGITYDPATGEIAANISTDAGNTTVIGTDGGLYTPAGSTALVSADTSTIDTTITGNGTAGDPYTIEADVIVAPDPNGVEVAANGLLVAPSADAGNQLAFGADGRLFVPEDPPLEIGCGLQGDGTAAAPLAAFPIAGLTAWADSWACTDTDHSTLKCDPDTGALWTPPEHFSAADHLYQEHMNPVVANQGPTGGWAFLQPGGAAAVLSFNVPGNFLGNQCRKWSYSSHCHGSIDISYSSTATFQVGYIYQENGAALQIRPLWGILTAAGSARRERYSGSTAETAFDVLPANGVTLNYFAAINVTAGTITINSWTSDGTIHTTTQSS